MLLLLLLLPGDREAVVALPVTKADTKQTKQTNRKRVSSDAEAGWLTDLLLLLKGSDQCSMVAVKNDSFSCTCSIYYLPFSSTDRADRAETREA